MKTLIFALMLSIAVAMSGCASTQVIAPLNMLTSDSFAGPQSTPVLYVAYKQSSCPSPAIVRVECIEKEKYYENASKPKDKDSKESILVEELLRLSGHGEINSNVVAEVAVGIIKTAALFIPGGVGQGLNIGLTNLTSCAVSASNDNTNGTERVYYEITYPAKDAFKVYCGAETSNEECRKLMSKTLKDRAELSSIPIVPKPPA